MYSVFRANTRTVSWITIESYISVHNYKARWVVLQVRWKVGRYISCGYLSRVVLDENVQLYCACSTASTAACATAVPCMTEFSRGCCHVLWIFCHTNWSFSISLGRPLAIEVTGSTVPGVYRLQKHQKHQSEG